jgi:hypothetical protein
MSLVSIRMALWIISRCPFYQGKGYGGLDFSPMLLNRAFGMTWSIGGWLLMRFLGKLAPVRIGELYKRVADEINTTFAIESTVELSFEEAMTPEVIEKYNAKTTGGKYILNPNKI